MRVLVGALKKLLFLLVLCAATTAHSQPASNVVIPPADLSRLAGLVFARIPIFAEFVREVNSPTIEVAAWGGTSRNIMAYVRDGVIKAGSVAAFEAQVRAATTIHLYSIHSPTSDLDVTVIPKAGATGDIIKAAQAKLVSLVQPSPFFDHMDLQDLSTAANTMQQYGSWEAASNVVVTGDGVQQPTLLTVDIGGGEVKNLSAWGLEQFSKGAFDFRRNPAVRPAVDVLFQITLRNIRFMTEFANMTTPAASVAVIQGMVNEMRSPANAAQFTEVVKSLENGGAGGATKRLQGAQLNSLDLARTRQLMRDFGLEKAITDVSPKAFEMRFFTPLERRPAGFQPDLSRRLGKEVVVYHGTPALGAARNISRGTLVQSHDGTFVEVRDSVSGQVVSKPMVAAFTDGLYAMQTPDGKPHIGYGAYPVEVHLGPNACVASYEEYMADPTLHNRVDAIFADEVTDLGKKTGNIIWVLKTDDAIARNIDGSRNASFTLEAFQRYLTDSVELAASGKITLEERVLLNVLYGLATFEDGMQSTPSVVKIVADLNKINPTAKYGDLFQLLAIQRLTSQSTLSPETVASFLTKLAAGYGSWKEILPIKQSIDTLVTQVSRQVDVVGRDARWPASKSSEVVTRLDRLGLATPITERAMKEFNALTPAERASKSAHIKAFTEAALVASLAGDGMNSLLIIQEAFKFEDKALARGYLDRFLASSRYRDEVQLATSEIQSVIASKTNQMLFDVFRTSPTAELSQLADIVASRISATGVVNGLRFLRKFSESHGVTDSALTLIRLNSPDTFAKFIDLASAILAKTTDIDDANGSLRYGMCMNILRQLVEVPITQSGRQFITTVLRINDPNLLVSLGSEYFRQPQRMIESPDLVASWVNQMKTSIASSPESWFVNEYKYAVKKIFEYGIDRLFVRESNGTTLLPGSAPDTLKKAMIAVAPLLELPFDFSNYSDDWMTRNPALKPLADALKIKDPAQRAQFVRQNFPFPPGPTPPGTPPSTPPTGPGMLDARLDPNPQPKAGTGKTAVVLGLDGLSYLALLTGAIVPNDQFFVRNTAVDMTRTVAPLTIQLAVPSNTLSPVYSGYLVPTAEIRKAIPNPISYQFAFDPKDSYNSAMSYLVLRMSAPTPPKAGDVDFPLFSNVRRVLDNPRALTPFMEIFPDQVYRQPLHDAFGSFSMQTVMPDTVGVVDRTDATIIRPLNGGDSVQTIRATGVTVDTVARLSNEGTTVMMTAPRETTVGTAVDAFGRAEGVFVPTATYETFRTSGGGRGFVAGLYNATIGRYLGTVDLGTTPVGAPLPEIKSREFKVNIGPFAVSGVHITPGDLAGSVVVIGLMRTAANKSLNITIGVPEPVDALIKSAQSLKLFASKHYTLSAKFAARGIAGGMFAALDLFGQAMAEGGIHSALDSLESDLSSASMWSEAWKGAGNAALGVALSPVTWGMMSGMSVIGGYIPSYAVNLGPLIGARPVSFVSPFMYGWLAGTMMEGNAQFVEKFYSLDEQWIKDSGTTSAAQIEMLRNRSDYYEQKKWLDNANTLTKLAAEDWINSENAEMRWTNQYIGFKASELWLKGIDWLTDEHVKILISKDQIDLAASEQRKFASNTNIERLLRDTSTALGSAEQKMPSPEALRAAAYDMPASALADSYFKETERARRDKRLADGIPTPLDKIYKPTTDELVAEIAKSLVNNMAKRDAAADAAIRAYRVDNPYMPPPPESLLFMSSNFNRSAAMLGYNPTTVGFGLAYDQPTGFQNFDGTITNFSTFYRNTVLRGQNAQEGINPDFAISLSYENTIYKAMKPTSTASTQLSVFDPTLWNVSYDRFGAKNDPYARSFALSTNLWSAGTVQEPGRPLLSVGYDLYDTTWKSSVSHEVADEFRNFNINKGLPNLNLLDTSFSNSGNSPMDCVKKSGVICKWDGRYLRDQSGRVVASTDLTTASYASAEAQYYRSGIVGSLTDTCKTAFGAGLNCDCTSNSQCGMSNVCIDRKCSAKSYTGGHCDEASDCNNFDSECRSGSCQVRSGGWCSFPSDCGYGRSCVSSRCM